MRKNKGKEREGGRRKGAVLRGIFLTLLILMAAGVAFLILIISRAPALDILDAEPDGYRTSVLDDEGNVVLTLSGQESNRVYVKLEEVPEDLQHAFVAVEEARFYTHHGIDLRGIARAFVQGVTHGRFSEGASTITQQLLKNNVFTDWTKEETFLDKLERKIQEQYLAIRLEMKVDKDWILENYLNTINLGGGNWGVQTAARYYFDKDVSELTLSECAVLAGITKNPTTYNPLKNPDKNSERRDKVLKNMLEQGYITQAEYDEAKADPVYERIAEAHSNGSSAEIMTYFEDMLIYQVLEDLMTTQSCSEEEAWNLIYRGGLTICSTENSALQTLAEEEANKEAYGSPEAQVSVVIIDNNTGAVRAMVGGRGVKDASLIYNRAVSAIRQPGSAIKIIGEYAAGLESKSLTLGTVYNDAPHQYFDGSEIHNADGRYVGATTVREAIVRSGNVVAVKCLQQIGVDAVYDSLADFGISTLTDDDKVEALALGGTYNGVTNLEMTAAYSAIARGGSYIEPVYYTRILDREGKVLVEKIPDSHRAVSEETAALLTLAMEDVMTRGTGTPANVDGMTLAGKSGTTTGAADSWFLGFSPEYTLGVWGGYDDNRAQSDVGYTKLIWHGIMAGTRSLTDGGSFALPEGLVSAEICTKCGKLAENGLCDSTVQGNMTTTEYYRSGTAPSERCDCHTKITICRDSGQKAGFYCPQTSREVRVYLNTAAPGTEDEPYGLPAGLETSSCPVHVSFWDKLFGGDSDEDDGDTDDDAGEDTGSDAGSNTGSNTEGDGGSTAGSAGSGAGSGNEGQGTGGTGSNAGSGDDNSSRSPFGDLVADWWNSMFSAA